MYTNKFLNILEKIFAGKREISGKIPACEHTDLKGFRKNSGLGGGNYPEKLQAT